MIKGYDIVCLGLTNWNTLWTRKQYFMNIFAESNNRVLYVDPTHSFLTKWVNPYLGETSTIRQTRIRSIKPNLWVLSPGTLLPAPRRYRISNWINNMVLKRLIRSAMRRLGMDAPLLWVYNPLSSYLAKSREWSLIIYACTDEHTAFPRTNAALVGDLERQLVGLSDVVIVTEAGLLPTRQMINPNIHYIPNGVDFDLFRQVVDTPLAMPVELSDLSRPLVGYVGAIGKWFDHELLYLLAHNHPDWSFVLVGPRLEKDGSSPAPNNVHFLGERPRETLPAYLAAFDVCINPFLLNELTRHVNPLKVYEYLCAGRPTVSVDLPSIRDLRDVLYIANDQMDFLSGIEVVLHQDTEDWRQRRNRSVINHSWTALAEQVGTIIEETLAMKGR